MPYEIRKTGEQWCVYKEGGESVACHETEAQAKDHMAALYANVSDAKAVKFVDGSEDEIEGLLLPWGGIFNGKDLDGERFSAKTNFCLDWFPDPTTRPLLWNHGLDEEAGTSVVGRIKNIEMKPDTGGWMRAQLDKQSKYFEAIKEMVKKGRLYLSSGAMSHLVQKAADGELLRWPVVEGSLTPTPSNLLATVGYPEVAKHYKAIESEIPDTLKPVEESATKAHLSDTLEAYDYESTPLADHAEGLSYIAVAFAQRTKALHERRIKEGRVLSAMNRRRIRECLDAMSVAAKDLQTLLDSTEPQPEGKAADVWRLRAQAKALEIYLLSVS